MMYDPQKLKWQEKYYKLKNSGAYNLPLPNEFNKSLYELYHVDTNQNFDLIQVSEIDYSQKTKNRLLRAGIFTIDDLFSKSINDLLFLPYIGDKTIPQLLTFCEDILYKSDIFSNSEEVFIDRNNEIPPFAFDYAISLIHNEKYDTSALSENGIMALNKIQNSFEILGAELFQTTLENEEGKLQFENILTSVELYSQYIEKIVEIDNQLSEIISTNPSLQEVPILPLINLYQKHCTFEFSEIYTDSDVLADIPDILSEKNSLPIEDLLKIANRTIHFLNLIGEDITEKLKKIRDDLVERDTLNRKELVVELQQEGNTLDEIGSLLNVTGERIRQLSNNATYSFISQIRCMDIDPILLIHCITGQKKLLYKSDIYSYLQDEKLTTWLWACLQSGKMNCVEYEYSPQLKAVNFRNVQGILPTEIDEVINSFPEIIDVEEVDNLIKEKAVNSNIPETDLKKSFSEKYISYGRMFSKNRLSKRFIVEWILQRCFPNGYKISNEQYEKRFRSFLIYNFGEKANDIESRALDTKISKIGVLCDRGKYIHPSRVKKIDKRLLDKIDEYIQKSNKTAISYKELFSVFQSDLTKYNITNQYYLQGVMNHFGNHGEKRTPYYSYRDFITKDKSYSKTDELNDFIKRKGIVDKAEIIQSFPELYREIIPQAIKRCPDVLMLGNGKYVHISYFDCNEREYRALMKYLKQATDKSPVNINSIFEECKNKFPDYIIRNRIESVDLFFAYLSYMFSEDFDFSKPYISRKENE